MKRSISHTIARRTPVRAARFCPGAAALALLCCLQLPAQAPPQPLPSTEVATDPATRQPAAPAQTGPDDDRFQGLRDQAEALKAAYEKLDNDSMDEVDRLLKTRRCQIARIGGLLERTVVSMHQWYEAEATYWTKWSEAEEDRINGQKKSVAEMEVQQQRVKDLIGTESKDREELLRKKETLQKYGKRSQDIVKEIDALIVDIKDSEDRLDRAQKQYDELTAQITGMNASLTARLIFMRQQLNRVEAVYQEYNAYYEAKRKDAQEICNLKQPGLGTQLPKSRQTQPPKQP